MIKQNAILFLALWYEDEWRKIFKEIKKYLDKTRIEDVSYEDVKNLSLGNYDMFVEKTKERCKALVDKIQFNEQENEKLAAIRDALLPKLMSGEIDVSNVDISALTSTDKLSFTEE